MASGGHALGQVSLCILDNTTPKGLGVRPLEAQGMEEKRTEKERGALGVKKNRDGQESFFGPKRESKGKEQGKGGNLEG